MTRVNMEIGTTSIESAISGKIQTRTTVKKTRVITEKIAKTKLRI